MPSPSDTLTEVLTAARTLRITAPIDLDGDAVGAAVGLARAVRRRFPACAVDIVVEEALPARYAFLETPTERLLRAQDVPPGPVDLVLVVDGEPGRLGAATPHYAAARRRGVVDHHKTADAAGLDVAIIDREAASTTEIVLALCDRWGVPLDEPLARALYAGLVFDTHVFRYRMTRPPTLRAAARLMEVGIDHAGIVERVLLQQPLPKVRLRGRMLDRMRLELDGRVAWAGLTAAECAGVETGGLVDDLVFIEGVEVGLLLIDRGDGRVKLSLRSRGGVDCSAVAQGLSTGGGGHARAAGASLTGGLEAAAARVIGALREALPPTP